MKSLALRALVVIGSALAALLISTAPAEAMSIKCFKTSTQHFDTMCVVIHDDGTKEYFMVKP